MEHGSVACNFEEDRFTTSPWICQYTCMDGFKLIGNTSRTCQSDGLWSGSGATCYRGVHSISALINYSHKCKDFYKLVGMITIKSA